MRGHNAVAAVGNVGEGAAVNDGGVVFQSLHQIGVNGILQQGSHGTGGLDVTGGHGLAVVGVGAHDLAKALFQILQAGAQAACRKEDSKQPAQG